MVSKTFIKIIGVGDIMPGGVLAGVNEGYVSQEVLEVLRKGDIRVGTLETAIGNSPTFNQEKMSRKGDVIYALDADLIKLKQLGMDVVSLANNHYFDLGAEGAEHTVRLLDEMGIKHVGAGRNLEEAYRPAVISVGGRSVAFIAFCECEEERIGWCPVATENIPGVNPLREEYMSEEIKRYKGLYDYVVVMPHWGKEGQTMPTDHQYRLAKRMMAAGADLILGSHVHCVQPVFHNKGKAVAFGMGNFLFPDRLIAPPRSTYYSAVPLDYSSLPVTDRYPYVDEVTFKKWRTKARFGCMVECWLDEHGARAKGKMTHLTKDNHLELSKGRYAYQGQLNLASLALRSGCFVQLYAIQEMMNKAKRIVKRVKKGFR